ncbi:Uncharacterised protein [Starkeya nomas]|uniref:Autochaperone domain-containing protein n=1 Tax=Starkeya nomas TaxID=2666134 RepID=A0A5S9Q4G5_9HYPH|nr:Uncharacterised protein [Starkeya nomas]
MQGTAANRSVLETAGFLGGSGTVDVTIDGGLLRATQDNAVFFEGFDTHDITLGANDGVIDTDGHDIGISPRFVGAGSLTKDGAGTLTLTGANIYTGNTTITAGTLQLGDGGTTGSIVGDVLDNGMLAFNRSDVVTFAGLISGSGVVSQDGTGTTIFTANNTYASGTTITAGTLQLGAGGTTGSILGNVLNNGALAFNRSDVVTFAGLISGSGAVSQDGTGTTIFTANNTYAGQTTVAAGTLAAGASSVFSPASRHVVAAGAALALDGYDQTIAGLSNAGLVSTGGAPGTTLTVTGDYAGNGGVLALNTTLGGDASPTDRLVVAGNTSGSTLLTVTNIRGTGALTVEGIKVVDVGGLSNGTFTLQGDYVFQGSPAVVGGAYAYRLYQDGIATPTDGDWYLRSTLVNPTPVDPTNPTPPAPPLYQPGVPLYEVYARSLLAFNGLPTLQQRVGNRYWNQPQPA